jgi:hypothetical protein
VRFQKFMWRNMMKSTKSQKASVLHYSIDMDCIWSFSSITVMSQEDFFFFFYKKLLGLCFVLMPSFKWFT